MSRQPPALTTTLRGTKLEGAVSKRIKNHHFVPKVLQKRFRTEDNRIWYSERGTDGRFSQPELRNIEKTFRIRNYYTVLENGQPSDAIERLFYGEIDNFLGDFIPEVLGIFDADKVPRLSEASLESARTVAMEMAKRTPEFVKQYESDQEIGQSLVESVLAGLEDETDFEKRSHYLEILNDPALLRQYGRDVRVRATVKRSEKTAEALKDFKVRWAVSETHHSFILSSMMAYRIGNGGPNGLINPNMEIWLPISPKISMVLTRDKANRIPDRVVEAPFHIREVNEYAARNSSQIASHSKRLIESLTGKKAKLKLAYQPEHKLSRI
ncbi:DUF4238 domain-containing protein [Phaeobacter inhibens]|uniref:DUF4238 domain-containing protein n=1 Tax=Phaeobacter inhibens TaxID=221822 RepID=UPI0021A388B3|nr:DUF4238 domain-containing protein [Phaeobacter inhibens]UWS07613.1 DUF4238 domain-containing protein [Phaeobacter inhibens]